MVIGNSQAQRGTDHCSADKSNIELSPVLYIHENPFKTKEINSYYSNLLAVSIGLMVKIRAILTPK